MKKLVSLLLALVLLVSVSACGQPSTGRSEEDEGPTWQEQYDLGVRYLSDGNYKEAIIAFTAAIEIDPKQAPAYVGRGDAYSGVAQKLSGQAGDAELPAEAVSSYENAVADYLAALDLDESTAEVYRKAAEVYVALGDLDSAITLLERGVAATEDKDLQTYLDELKAKQSLFVLIREDSYSALDDSEMHSVFTYDQAGYQVSWDSWSVYGEGTEDHWYSVTWSYDEVQNVWIREAVENGESETEVLETRQPGTYDQWGSHFFGKGYAYSNSRGSYEIKEGYTVSYTYDGDGNAIRIDTYDASGTLTGYCVLTWEKINLTEGKDLG